MTRHARATSNQSANEDDALSQDDEETPHTQWPAPGTPFLSQPRAHSALRHEFGVLVTDITALIERGRASRPNGEFELIVLPHRVIARVDDVAISFSWVSGRLPTVADGCLLVIAWSNVSSGVTGVAALKAATPLRERTYLADGRSSDDWGWCAADVAEQPCSTEHLTAEWMAQTAVAETGHTA